MKKINSMMFLSLALLCLAFVGGCAVYPSVVVNNWNFAPQQANGTELDLSLIAGSELEFNFTIKNEGEARDLLASTFDVIFTTESGESSALSIYFDNHQTRLSFVKYESKNIVLHAVSNTTVSESRRITITYDGQTLVQYLVR